MLYGAFFIKRKNLYRIRNIVKNGKNKLFMQTKPKKRSIIVLYKKKSILKYVLNE